MWRVLRLTLASAVTAATVANAASQSDAAQGSVDSALQQTSAVASKALRPVRSPGPALQLPFGGVLALTQPSLRAQIADQERARVVAPRLAPRLALRRAVLPRWLDLGGARPTLAYPVTDSISLGVRYSYQRSEDLVFKAAKAGALKADYENHKVLLSAQWEF